MAAHCLAPLIERMYYESMTTAPYPPAETDAVASSPAELTALWFRTLIEGVTGTARIAGMLEAVQASQIAELVQMRRAEAVVEARDAVAEGRRFWSDAEAVERSTVDEVAAALRVSTGVAGRRIADAESLVGRPVTLRALAEGRIHARAAYAIAEGVGVLSGQAADRAEARVLAAAGGQTPAQVAAAVRRVVIAADPAAADRAYRRATEARSARCRPEGDGMASIWVRGTADRIARAWQSATAVADHRRHLARAAGRQPATEVGGFAGGDHDTDDEVVAAGGAVIGKGNPARVPTLDQARADAMLDLLATPVGLPDPCSHPEADGHAEADRHMQPKDHAGADAAGPDHCAALPPMDVAVHLVPPVDALGAEPAELDGHGPAPPAFVADLLGGPPCPCRGATSTTTSTAPTMDDTDRTDRRYSTERGDRSRFLADAGTRVRFTRWLVDGPGLVTTTSQRVFTTYRPPPTLDATIRARDLTCRFPGCRTKARYCDIDHGIPYPAGATTAANLACLCRRHHRLKTHTRWRVTHRAGAVLEWTAPTGHTYLTYPPKWLIGRPGASDETTTHSPTKPPPHEAVITPPAWMFGRSASPHPSPPEEAAPIQPGSTGKHEPAASRPPRAHAADELLPPF